MYAIRSYYVACRVSADRDGSGCAAVRAVSAEAIAAAAAAESSGAARTGRSAGAITAAISNVRGNIVAVAASMPDTKRFTFSLR